MFEYEVCIDDVVRKTRTSIKNRSKNIYAAKNDISAQNYLLNVEQKCYRKKCWRAENARNFLII